MSTTTDEPTALVPYDHDPALTPDAILDGPVRLAGEYDPEAARLRAREGLMALENLPYHMARAVEPIVVAMQNVAKQIAASMDSPEGRRLAALLDAMTDEPPQHPTRHARHMARVAATPRRRKGHRRHR